MLDLLEVNKNFRPPKSGLLMGVLSGLKIAFGQSSPDVRTVEPRRSDSRAPTKVNKNGAPKALFTGL